MIELIPYSADAVEDWNALNRVARNGHFMFDRGFMEYHADRFEDFSWIVLKDGALAGLLPASRSDDAAHSHQGLTFGGLVTGDLRTLEVLHALDLWREACVRAGLRALTFKPLPHIYHRRPSEEALFWLHRNDAELVHRDIGSAVRLASPGPWSNRRKRGAKRAQAAGLTVQHSERWGEYWGLLEEVLLNRHDVRPVHSLAEIQLLASRFPEEIRLYTVEQRGEVVAGTVMFCTPRVAHAQYIAAGELARDLGALDRLYGALFAVFQGDAAYFDFGISNERGTGDLNIGLITQKEEFGAGAVVYDQYRVGL
jgi:hypothetical protein